ncbi:response regulator transcription factor [Metabacillus sp. Hm71]|uniref:response regulator transcription factor n=1 Tax=Metabacillus sp. Hm71 TaxID=3450743 RepID=UPI003F43A59E
MYKILIVDDDSRERIGIQKLILKMGYNLEILQAQNGEEAYHIIQKQPIDILITDIKMPFLNGIELIKEVQKVNRKIVCIIYSAYGEFEYAQDAVSLGVIKYLLKPISLTEFKDLIDDVIQICDLQKENEKKEAQTNEAITRLQHVELEKNIFNFLERENNVPEYKKNILEAQPLFKGKYIPLIISSQAAGFYEFWDTVKQEFKRNFYEEPLFINIEENKILVILFYEKKMKQELFINEICNWLIEIAEKNFQIYLFMILGNLLKGIDNFKNEIHEMQKQLDYQFFVTSSTFLYRDKNIIASTESDMIVLYFENIYTNITIKNYDGIHLELKQIFHYIKNKKDLNSIYVKYLFTEMVKQLCDVAGYNTKFTEIVNSIYMTKNLEEIEKIITKFIQRIRKQNRYTSKENKKIIMAKNIVLEHFSDHNLSLSWIAEQLDVSSGYLSTLFKLETGENLVKYITNVRIEKAKYLLRCTDLRISDVSLHVGYQNQSYFISLFRNKEGMSPAQFREREQADG